MTRIIITILTITLLFSSCTIYEDVYFSEDGSVKYNMAVDMSQMTQGMGDVTIFGENSIPLEPISVAEILKDSIKNIDSLSEEHKHILKDLEPFQLHAILDEDSDEFILNLTGKFANSAQLTKGLCSLNMINEIRNSLRETKDEPSIAIVSTQTVFTWDGLQMTRDMPIIELEGSQLDSAVLSNEEANTIQDENSLIGQMMKSMSQMLGMGEYIIRYHFENEISSVNNDNFDISDDRKVVTFQYPGAMFMSQDLEKTIIKVN